LDKDIVIDDSQISRSTTWSSEQIYEAIISYSKVPSGGGNLKYREINDVINLKPGQELQKDYDLGDNPIIITTVYLDIVDGSNFQFKVLDKILNGFLLYDTGKISHYTDSVFIPYKDKDTTLNKLHTQIINFNLNSDVTLNMKILGLEVQI